METTKEKFQNTDCSEVLNEQTVTKVFDLFTGKNDLFPATMKPFKANGFWYAMDPAAFIRVPENKIEFNQANPFYSGQFNPGNSIPKRNNNEVINLDEAFFLQHLTDEKIDCGLCYGSGKLSTRDNYKGNYYDSEYNCPCCKGSGYEMEEDKYVFTGNKVFKSDRVAKIKNAFFQTKFIYKLMQVHKLIGGEIKLLNTPGGKTPALFQITDFEIMIMPLSTDVTDCESDYLNIA